MIYNDDTWTFFFFDSIHIKHGCKYKCIQICDLVCIVAAAPRLPQPLLHFVELLPQRLHLIHQSRLLVVQLSVRNHRFTVLLLSLRQRVLQSQNRFFIFFIFITVKPLKQTLYIYLFIIYYSLIHYST